VKLIFLHLIQELPAIYAVRILALFPFLCQMNPDYILYLRYILILYPYLCLNIPRSPLSSFPRRKRGKNIFVCPILATRHAHLIKYNRCCFADALPLERVRDATGAVNRTRLPLLPAVFGRCLAANALLYWCYGSADSSSYTDSFQQTGFQKQTNALLRALDCKVAEWDSGNILH
jgi:hypothetical protein